MTARHATDRTARAILCAGAILAATGPAMVSAQAPASAADSTVSVAKADQIVLSKVDDILIGVFGPDEVLDARTFRVDQFDYQCVYSTTGGYRLDITSANGTGPFELENASGDRMGYEVHLWYRRAGGAFQFTSTRYPTAPIAVPGLSASRSPTCADEALDNSNLIVTGVVNAGPFNAAPPGVYRDVLTITVSVE